MVSAFVHFLRKKLRLIDKYCRILQGGAVARKNQIRCNTDEKTLVPARQMDPSAGLREGCFPRGIERGGRLFPRPLSGALCWAGINHSRRRTMHMTNFKRRLVSTALAVTMAVTLLPLPATAADAQKDISIGWNAQEPQTTMEQVTVDLTASLSDASGIDSADVYIELTESEYNALDKTPFSESSDVKLVTELPAEDTSDDTEEPDAEEPGEEGSGEEPGDQNQDQGQQPSKPNTGARTSTSPSPLPCRRTSTRRSTASPASPTRSRTARRDEFPSRKARPL